MIVLKRYEEFLAVFHALGIEIEGMDSPKAGPIRIKCRHIGRNTIFYMPNSPSDHRASKNFHGEVRRWFKGADR